MSLKYFIRSSEKYIQRNTGFLSTRIKDNITAGEWTLVFRAQKLINSSVFDIWNQTGLSHDNPVPYGFPMECISMSYDPKCDRHFRSHILDDWVDIYDVRMDFMHVLSCEILQVL
ncbi:hypothetical protein ElyMa_004971800 [Elysia marginata]|uniref:Uncharacterized protein n=1 Tax=Elysia marginata TaxID=1093978 RepID=A0AAV4J2K0_9GAST|nr:hypothetical protein ElyMa_004971800 [Elysia marginata]